MDVASSFQWSSPTNALGAIFAIILLLASAWAIFRTAAFKEQLSSLRDDRDDLMVRSNIQKDEIAELKAQVQAERSARMTLERVVTGRDQLEHIAQVLEAHDKKSGARTDQIIKAIGGLKAS